MYNTDIETFYKRINNHINLVGIITENKYLPKIIRMCRMKPLEIVAGKKFDFDTHMVGSWIDEFGYMLLAEKQKWSIEFNNNYELVSTDLFFGRNLKDTLNMSRSAMRIYYEEEDTVICCGRDDFLRAFKITNDGAERIAPLSVGVDILSIICDNYTTVNKKTFGQDINMFPCPVKQGIEFCVSNRVLKEIE